MQYISKIKCFPQQKKKAMGSFFFEEKVVQTSMFGLLHSAQHPHANSSGNGGQ